MIDNLIQIAGIVDEKEARTVIDCGVEFLGFPLRLPVHKEDLSEDDARKIISDFPENVRGVLITYLDNAKEIIDFVNFLNVNFVQLHGEIELPQIEKVKSLKPKLEIIKSLIVRGDNLPQLENEIRKFENAIDYFITDTFDPKTGATGATGKTHDWKISRKITELSIKPVILAGGLNDDNVYDAIKFVKPFGVDSHTGVENSSGRKDQKKIKRFLSEAKRAFDEIKGLEI
ncbi:MAG: phosphoribosylanthranilate isomerase [Chlorobi bacterium]|nr:phosphoribosylanthranilate isomerase [Chlorobiota bacterium]